MNEKGDNGEHSTMTPDGIVMTKSVKNSLRHQISLRVEGKVC